MLLLLFSMGNIVTARSSFQQAEVIDLLSSDSDDRLAVSPMANPTGKSEVCLYRSTAASLTELYQ